MASASRREPRGAMRAFCFVVLLAGLVATIEAHLLRHGPNEETVHSQRELLATRTHTASRPPTQSMSHTASTSRTPTHSHSKTATSSRSHTSTATSSATASSSATSSASAVACPADLQNGRVAQPVVPSQRIVVPRGMAMTADGKTALIAAFSGAFSGGEVYVYTRTDASDPQGWSEVTTLADIGPRVSAPGDAFGNVAAISDDGKLIATVGEASGQSAVYVYSESEQVSSPAARALTRAPRRQYTLKATLTPAIQIGVTAARHISSLSMSGNGELIVVGSMKTDTGGAAAWVRTGDSTWTAHDLTSVSTGAEHVSFGAAVCAATDGSAVLVSDPDMFSSIGGFHLLQRGADNAFQLLGTYQYASPGDRSGTSMSCSVTAAGGTVVLGATGANGGQGGATVFTLPALGSGGGVGAQHLSPNGISSTPSGLGYAVWLARDASVVLLGAPHSNQVAAYAPVNGVWRRFMVKDNTGIVDNTASDNFGAGITGAGGLSSAVHVLISDAGTLSGDKFFVAIDSISSTCN